MLIKNMGVKVFTFIFIFSAILLTGCAQKPVRQNDYFNTLEKSKKSLDELKRINEETKAKAEAYQKDQLNK
jgi:hypothetical protein